MTTPTTDDTREVVNAIASRLGERHLGARAQIRQIVHHLGPGATIGWVEHVEAIEAAGGQTLPDGRRRTLGGIFFRSIKEALSDDDREHIFGTRTIGAPGGRNAQQADDVITEPQDIEIPNATGEVRTVKITVIGRPGRIVRDPRGFVSVAMQQSKVPALPKGVPAPPTAPTQYTVSIAQKQWQKIADAVKDPEDVLIVEGFPTATPQGITVYGTNTNTTTKQLQQAQRAAQQVRKQ